MNDYIEQLDLIIEQLKGLASNNSITFEDIEVTNTKRVGTYTDERIDISIVLKENGKQC